MPLFEVAITIRPTKAEAEEGKAERLVMHPTAVIARDAQSAGINAVLGEDIPDSVKKAPKDRMQVHVRPFA